MLMYKISFSAEDMDEEVEDDIPEEIWIESTTPYDDLDYFDRNAPENSEYNIADLTEDVERVPKYHRHSSWIIPPPDVYEDDDELENNREENKETENENGEMEDGDKEYKVMGDKAEQNTEIEDDEESVILNNIRKKRNCERILKFEYLMMLNSE